MSDTFLGRLVNKSVVACESWRSPDHAGRWIKTKCLLNQTLLHSVSHYIRFEKMCAHTHTHTHTHKTTEVEITRKITL